MTSTPNHNDFIVNFEYEKYNGKNTVFHFYIIHICKQI